MKKLIYILLAAFVLMGCDDDPPVVEPDPADIEITFNHNWDGRSLNLDSWYVTENGDSFKPTMFIYHLNHIELIDADGQAHQAMEWDMVDYELNQSKTYTFDQTPQKTYKKIRFTIGVEDSAVNASGYLNNVFQDPLYWGMAAGYINFKLEGTYRKDNADKLCYYHIGGYLNIQQTARVIELDLPSDVKPNVGVNAIDVDLDLAHFFHSPNTIDLATVFNVQQAGEIDAIRMADNWASMFSVR